MNRFRRWIMFNLWYFGRPPWDSGVTPPEVREFIQAHPPGRALDLGCGSGQNLLTLAQAGWQVTGIDFAFRAIRRARRRLRDANLPAQIHLGDVTTFRPTGGPFDLILDMGCYHGLPDNRREAYRGNVVNWLAPGGTFLIYAHLAAVTEQSETAVTEAEISLFSAALQLARRQDSLDRWERRAVWLEFTRPPAART